MNTTPSRAAIELMKRFETCAVANAIESFDLRLRNEGFARAGANCLFPQLAPIVGHAVTVKMRSSAPPPQGHAYQDRTDWWNFILKIPAPRIVVVEDVDVVPGTGALIGEIHARILKTLGCVGAITNGVVRDVPAIQKIGFQLFAGGLGVSHAYAHLIEVGGAVSIGGLKINSGDLLHGDAHGILSVPAELVEKLPGVIVQLMEREREIIALCESKDFTLQKLRAAVTGLPWRDGHPH